MAHFALWVMRSRARCIAAWLPWIVLVLAAGMVAGDESRRESAAPTPPAAAAPRETEVRGRVVCLAEEMHRLHGVDLPANHPHLYGFRTRDGRWLTLLRTKFSLGLFDDARLREKELILRGRLFPDSHLFEPVHLKSVRNGVVHELYYFCVICDIRSLDPGPCACCQEPVELVEKPE